MGCTPQFDQFEGVGDELSERFGARVGGVVGSEECQGVDVRLYGVGGEGDDSVLECTCLSSFFTLFMRIYARFLRFRRITVCSHFAI